MLCICLGAWPAFAQEKKPFILEKTYRNVISPDTSHLYAQYYVPYGILAAASNNDVTKLDDGGIDSIFTNEYVGSEQLGENIRTLAVQSTKPWHYEFNCYGLDNDHCDSAAGPPFQVWTRMAPKSEACDEVSIAFAGTRPFWTWQGIRGWLSNGRVANTEWFVESYYQQLQRNIDLVVKKITTLPCYTRRLQKGSTPVIVSVGHSLGAGLAEFAALANSASSKKQSFPDENRKGSAFDPSAETGGDLIEKDLLRRLYLLRR